MRTDAPRPAVATLESGRLLAAADTERHSRPRFLDNPTVRKWFDRFALFGALYLVQQLLWPAPLGVLVQGSVVGGLTALIAFGVALVYRSNRVINFAQGDLGGAPATLAILLIVGPQWPFFVAMAVAVVAAIALGALVEFALIRRFFRAPRLILTVVTIGLAQILASMELMLPRFFDLTVPPQSFPSPFDFSFTIDPIVFRGNDVIAMLAVPVAIGALLAFFRYTHIGIAVRASAESADRAALLGVPVKRIHTYVWVIATLLATVAMVLRAGIFGLPIGAVLGPGILLRALAAAVIGRMENLPVIFFAAVGLGVIEQAVLWDTGKGLLADPILFVVVIGALLLQRRGQTPRTDEASSWEAAKEVRPVPRELVALPEVRRATRLLKVAGVVAALSLPLWLSESRTSLAAAVVIFGIIGLSLVVLTGWAGQISLGQMAFVGIGAAVGAWVTNVAGLDVVIGVLVAGAAGAAVAVVVGLPALRLRGLFLAVATLAFALATSSYLLNSEFFAWIPTDRIQRRPALDRVSIMSETRFYYFALTGLAVALIAVRGLRNSRTGRALVATRENERAVQAAGVNAARAKLTAFAISGFLAAYAGAFLVHHQQGFLLSSFDPAESLRVFTMVVIGGLGSVPGALLGAAFVLAPGWFLPSDLRFLNYLTSGAGLVLVLMLLPGGLGSVMYAARDRFLRRVARRRGLIVPSLVADLRASDDVPSVAGPMSENREGSTR